MEPHSFLEFIQVKQLENAIPDEKLKGLFSAIYDRRQKGGTGGSATDELRELKQLSFKSKKVMKKLEMKVSLMGAEAGIRVWSESAVHALALPESPSMITLEKREEEILQIVSVYAFRYWPEMLDSLDLRVYLEMVKEEDR